MCSDTFTNLFFASMKIIMCSYFYCLFETSRLVGSAIFIYFLSFPFKISFLLMDLVDRKYSLHAVQCIFVSVKKGQLRYHEFPVVIGRYPLLRGSNLCQELSAVSKNMVSIRRISWFRGSILCQELLLQSRMEQELVFRGSILRKQLKPLVIK